MSGTKHYYYAVEDSIDTIMTLTRENERLITAFAELKQCEVDNVAEIERLRAALREIANMDDPAISAQQVAADALEGKDF